MSRMRCDKTCPYSMSAGMVFGECGDTLCWLQPEQSWRRFRTVWNGEGATPDCCVPPAIFQREIERFRDEMKARAEELEGPLSFALE